MLFTKVGKYVIKLNDLHWAKSGTGMSNDDKKLFDLVQEYFTVDIQADYIKFTVKDTKGNGEHFKLPSVTYLYDTQEDVWKLTESMIDPLGHKVFITSYCDYILVDITYTETKFSVNILPIVLYEEKKRVLTNDNVFQEELCINGKSRSL